MPLWKNCARTLGACISLCLIIKNNFHSVSLVWVWLISMRQTHNTARSRCTISHRLSQSRSEWERELYSVEGRWPVQRRTKPRQRVLLWTLKTPRGRFPSKISRLLNTRPNIVFFFFLELHRDRRHANQNKRAAWCIFIFGNKHPNLHLERGRTSRFIGVLHALENKLF